jgi:Mn2+/Fe2+ NRAMP family transporter
MVTNGLMARKPEGKAGSASTVAAGTRASKRPSEVDITKGRTGPVWRQYLRAMGPGLVTGASDDDPSGIATYSQAGARFGFSFLWAALLTLPLMAAVQEICDRTALATGTGLGELAVKRFQRAGRTILAVLLAALIIANGLNIAADLVAVGSGMQLLHAGPTWLWALLAGALITTLLVLGDFARIALVFKVLCAALLAYLALLVAVLGTTISPYLFFWQSAHRLEEMREEPEGGSQAQPLKDQPTKRAKRKQSTSRLDVFVGMTFSNLVMFAIIVATAQTLHVHHRTDIQSAAQAAEALKPVAGHFASTIFALGFIGSGLLAIPVLAGSGSVGMAGLLGKHWGFSRSIRKAPVFYGLVALGTAGGTALSLLHVNPIKLLVFVAVLNGVIAAPFLFVVMRVSSSKQLMGDYVNGKAAKILGWTTAALMGVAAIALFATGGVSL